jgi:hypothetical protein
MKLAYFLPEKDHKKWKKFVENSFFEEVMNYFLGKGEDVIKLREMKIAFPDLNVDKYIEEGINLGVFERRDRRYNLLLKIEEVKPEIARFDSKSLLKDFTKNELTGILFNFLVKNKFVLTDKPLFFDADSKLYQGFIQTPIATASSEQGSLIHFNAFDTLAHNQNTLANYFERIDTREELSEGEEKLYALVGDVNPDYVMHAFGIELMKYMKKDQVKPLRKDIFIEALVQLEFIRVMTDGVYELNTPILEEATMIDSELGDLAVPENVIERQFLLKEILDSVTGNYFKQFVQIHD